MEVKNLTALAVMTVGVHFNLFLICSKLTGFHCSQNKTQLPHSFRGCACSGPAHHSQPLSAPHLQSFLLSFLLCLLGITCPTLGTLHVQFHCLQ